MIYGNIRQFQLYDHLLIEKMYYRIEDMVLEAATALEKHIPKNKKGLIICGVGNNGADGLALAYLLKTDVSVFLVGEQTHLSNAAKHYLSYVISENIPVIHELDRLTQLINDADYIVDGIFGTGFKGMIKDDLASIVNLVNSYKSSKTIISIDIPSGMNGDTGEVKSVGINADFTVTFVANKLAFLNPEAKAYTGNIYVETILSNKEVFEEVGFSRLLNKEEIEVLLKQRIYNGYKGTYGKLLCCVGSEQYPGAALLSVGAALHTGCGFVNYDGPDYIKNLMISKYPEVIYQKYSSDFDAVLFGCGKGFNKTTAIQLEDLISQSCQPLLIDADGLNCLSLNSSILTHKKVPIILTPHVGEMRRLYEGDSVLAAISYAREYDVIVVLKGANTFITNGKRHVRIPAGHKAMAVAGMGDCLSGIIASLLAQKYEPFNAAILGVYIHGLCGEKIAELNYTVLPSNLLNEIPGVMNEIIKRTN